MSTSYQPEGYHTITPYLTVSDAHHVIDFLKAVFGAEITLTMEHPDGSIRHVELRIGDSLVMVGQSPNEADTMPAMLYVYVPDPDATYDRAMQAGATSVMEPSDQDYGDRVAAVQDETGNQWWLARSLER